MSSLVRMIMTTFLFVACTSCRFMVDPNTKDIAIVVAELTGAYLLRRADSWAELEQADGDQEWKDTVADIWLELRKAYRFSEREVRLVEDEVSHTLKQLKHHKPFIVREKENGSQ